MAKIPVPDLNGIRRFIKRKKRSRKNFKFIFTAKQWGFFFLALIIGGTASGLITWGVHYSNHKKQAAEEASQKQLLSSGTDQYHFELRKIVIPSDFQGKRNPEPGKYRIPMESWSDEQIMGSYGEGEWTDPSVISTEIFEDKNELLIKELLQGVE